MEVERRVRCVDRRVEAVLVRWMRASERACGRWWVASFWSADAFAGRSEMECVCVVGFGALAMVLRREAMVCSWVESA